MACADEDVFDSDGEGNSAEYAAPYDYASSTGYWGGILDDSGGGNLVYTGTILEGDTDWIVVQVSDDVVADAANYSDYFNTEFVLTDIHGGNPADQFTMKVHRGAYDAAQECSTNTVGYTYYNYCHDGSNAAPDHSAAPEHSCRDLSYDKNQCMDYSTTFWIEISLNTSSFLTSCNPYTLTISNGAWATTGTNDCQLTP
jgi:hypothetical protein